MAYHNYQCDLPSSKCNAITLDPLISQYPFQAMQHVADSWHSQIGSSVVMVLITFFKANPELFATNGDRQEGVAWYLCDNCYLYKHADGDDSSICSL